MPWLFSEQFRKRFPEEVRETKRRFAKGYLTRDSEAFERQIKANISADTKGLLHQIDVPTLIIVGKNDELTPPRMAEELKAEIPNAELLVFEQGGHGLYWEADELFNRAVIEFLLREKRKLEGNVQKDSELGSPHLRIVSEKF